ncbi:hypothetical protein Tco_0998886 [Tanacetum coccineum]
MIGCKVMKTLGSVEIEIMLILGLPCCLSSSSVRCLENVVDSRRMSTPVFVDTEISTQADGAQSSRVPIPLPKDTYKVIRQTYLDGMDTESEPFEDPVKTEKPESPITVALPTSLPESTSSTLVPILCRTTQMVVRVPPAMSPGLSTSIAEVAAMSEPAFRKRFRSSYESLPSSSLPDLPSQKRYRATVSEDAKDKGPTADDEDPAIGDEDLAVGDEGPNIGVGSHGLDDESHGLEEEVHSIESDGLGLREEEEAIPESQQQAVPVAGTAGSGNALEPERPERVSASRQPTLTTWTDPEDGLVYIDVPAYPPPALPAQIPRSPEWSSGPLLISPSHYIVHSPISSPMIPLTVPSPIATPATAETERFLTELGAQVKMHGGLIRDHAVRLEELSPILFERYDRDIEELFTRSGRYRFRSLEHE